MLRKSYETNFIGYWILWNWQNRFHRQRNAMKWNVLRSITALTKKGHFETCSHNNPLKLKLALVKPEMTSPKFKSTACQGSFQYTMTKEDHFWCPWALDGQRRNQRKLMSTLTCGNHTAENRTIVSPGNACHASQRWRDPWATRTVPGH